MPSSEETRNMARYFRRRTSARWAVAVAILAAGLGGARLMGFVNPPLTASFSSTSFFTGQLAPNSLAVADFNGDGAPDVAVSAGAAVVTLKGATDANGLPTGGLTLFQTSTFNPAAYCAGKGIRSIVLGSNTAFSYNSPIVYGSLAGNGLTFHINSSSGFPSAGTNCDNMVVNGQTNTSLTGIATGDFDGNGYDDAAAVQGDGNVYIAAGSGYGTALTSFSVVIAVPGGFTASAVAVGDFNGDGRPDIVTGGGTGVAFFPAAKADPFATPDQIFSNATAGSRSIGGALNIRRVLIADATGDGKADIVAVTAGSIVVLPGNGAGAFGSPITLSMPVNFTANAATAGDFNHDGLPDIAVAASGSGGASNATVQIFYGEGGGTFSAAVATTIGGNPSADLNPADIATADMDRDGRDDLVVSTADDGNVWVLLNTTPRLVISNERGLELQAVTGKPFSGYGTLTVGTSDNGSVPVLAAAPAPNSPSLNWVTLAVTGNQVTITPNIAQAPGTGTYHGVAAISGSGYGSVLAPYTVTIRRPSAQLIRGGASGTAATGVPGYNGSSGPTSRQMAIGDFSGDGIPDIAGVIGYTCAGSPQSCAGVFARRADGTAYTLPTQSQTASHYNSAVAAVASGDFNLDGNLDAVYASGGNDILTFAFGDGHGGFKYSRFYFIPNANLAASANLMTVTDLNGDGYPDVALATTAGIVVALNNRDTTFSVSVFAAASSFHSLAVADFNGDGIPDIAARNQTANTVDVYPGLGGGRYGAAQHVSFLIGSCSGTTTQCTRPAPQTANPFSGTIVAADFNGDGLADLAFIDNPDPGPLNPAVVVALSSADASHNLSFTLGQEIPTFAGSSYRPFHLATADINGDGKSDLAYEATTYGAVVVLYGNGDGTLGGETHYTNGYTFIGTNSPLILADLDGDGRTDLIGPNFVGDYSGTAVGILMGGPGPAVSLSVTLPPTSTAGSAASAQVSALDANGDAALQYTGTIHFTSTDSSAVLPSNYTFLATDLSAKSFNVTFKTAGGRSLTATDTTTASITGMGSTTVQAGAPAFLSLNSPAATARNTAFGSLIAHVTDAYNNPLNGATVNFSTVAGTTGADGALGNGGTAVTASGDATISVTANGHSGNFTVNASTGSANGSRILNILPGPPALMTPSGTPQTVGLGSQFGPFSVTVTDSDGTPLSGQTVTFSAPASGASGTFQPNLIGASAVTNASGVATAPTFTANTQLGSYTVTASLNALHASIALTNTIFNGYSLATQVTVGSTPFLYNHATQRYSTTVTVKNTGATTLANPLLIFNNLPASISVYNAGTVYGIPYISLGALTAGQSTSVVVQFVNPSNGPITFTPLVYN